MFILDSSASMGIIPPEPVPADYSYTCTDATSIIADGTSLELDVDGTGADSYPEIDLGETDDYPLGNTGGTTRCFDPTFTYNANLNDDIDTDPSNQVAYSGKYLNWYFDTSTDSGTDNWDTKDYKPGSRTRMDVSRSSLNGLLDTLKSVNVGLTTFNPTDAGNGGKLDVPIAGIDTNLSVLKAAVNNVDPEGGSPLAETLLDVGRYFSNSNVDAACGGGSTNLTIHPDASVESGLKQDVACKTLLPPSSSTTFIAKNGPVEFFCQKNFAVMITDGVPTNDFDIPLDLQDYDGDCPADAIIDGTCLTFDRKATDPDPLSDYLDDVAQALFEIDLQPDLNNKQGYPHKNNITTYTIGFADKDLKTSSLITDTAKQGGGEYYYADDSTGLSTILSGINSGIEGKSGTAAAVTFNSSTLSSQSAVYQALFNTQRWSGQLRSLPLDGFTGQVKTDTCTDAVSLAGTLANCWDAAAKLDAQTTRNIITYNPDINKGVPFRLPDSPSYDAITGETIPKILIDDLCVNSPFGCATNILNEKTDNHAYMQDLVAYLRGDRTHEVQGTARDFRQRGHVLGDVVNSSPVYVGKPALSWPQTAPFPLYPEPGATDNTYSTWASGSIKDRVPVVYVAANDGMLHGFRALDSSSSVHDAGEEVLAYIPSSVASTQNSAGLHYLANPNYLHHFYVDLNPALSDVYIKHRKADGLTTASKEWRTVLVGGQGAGGNTMFMLDVTEPGQKGTGGTTGSTFTEAQAKKLIEWEFSTANLGYTYSKPTIAMMNNGRFAAIFGNGYNSDHFGGDCKAKLFVVFLDGGVDGGIDDKWIKGTDYLEIDTASGATGDCNGLSTPAVVDLNGDSVADKAYAGDVHGNLWSFDLCEGSIDADGKKVCEIETTNWGVALSGGLKQPIMTAKNASLQRQPITVKPVVSIDPNFPGTDNLIIAFGTGQYLTNNDITSTEVQSFYGIRHENAFTDGGSFGLTRLSKGQDAFTTQTMTEVGSNRTITNNAATHHWLIDFDISSPGERIVVNPKIRNNTLFFNTVIPDSTTCNAGGNGWLMSVDLATGGEPLKIIYDTNGDGIIDGLDMINDANPAGQKTFAIPAESTFLGDKQYTPDSEGNIANREVNIGVTTREGRMSWKEIYEDL